MLTSLGLRASAFALSRLPWRGLAYVGAALGFFAGSVARIRRSAVDAAMARAGIGSWRQASRAMYANLGTSLLELLWLASVPRARREKALARHVNLDPELESALLEALARGPVVLAASHTGNWEALAFAAAKFLAVHGRTLGVVVKPQSVGFANALCTHLRLACGLVLVAPEGALYAARRMLLEERYVVAMPIDQVPEHARHGLPIPFFGAEAWTSRGPAALACATRATMLVVAASRRGRMTTVGHVLAVIRAGARDGDSGLSGQAHSPRAWIDSATVEATRALETFIRREPASWLWLHRRWRAPLEPVERGNRGNRGVPSARVVTPAAPTHALHHLHHDQHQD